MIKLMLQGSVVEASQKFPTIHWFSSDCWRWTPWAIIHHWPCRQITYIENKDTIPTAGSTTGTFGCWLAVLMFKCEVLNQTTHSCNNEIMRTSKSMKVPARAMNAGVFACRIRLAKTFCSFSESSSWAKLGLVSGLARIPCIETTYCQDRAELKTEWPSWREC